MKGSLQDFAGCLGLRLHVEYVGIIQNPYVSGRCAGTQWQLALGEVRVGWRPTVEQVIGPEENEENKVKFPKKMPLDCQEG